MSKPPELLIKHLEKEKDRMYRIAWKMCGNTEDAEEVFQETVLKALKNWDRFRGDAQISTWLYRIASNTCLSRLRKKNLQYVDPETLDGLPSGSNEQHLSNVPNWASDPLAETLNEELREALDKAIMKLPDTYRIVFLMRDIEGMSGQETADSLGISLSNVKVRLHRARMFLRNELEKYFMSAGGKR